MQGWKNCNGSCRICSNYCCPLRKESMQPSPTNEELAKEEVASFVETTITLTL